MSKMHLLSATYYLLPTTYYVLSATYYLLPTTYYLLPTTYYLLPTTYYLLPTTYYVLSPTCSAFEAFGDLDDMDPNSYRLYKEGMYNQFVLNRNLLLDIHTDHLNCLVPPPPPPPSTPVHTFPPSFNLNPN